MEFSLETYRQLVHVALQHSLQVELLELALQAGRQPRVHGGASGQDDVLVELGPSGSGDRVWGEEEGSRLRFSFPY